MRLLVTAFEPFGGEAYNAAQEALRLLPDALCGAEILRIPDVPVVFGLAAETVISAVARTAPDAVLCLGQAAGRAALTPERQARNFEDARIPDNAGNQPRGAEIVPGAPEFLPATLPVEAMAEAVRAAGMPSAVSDSAGEYVCNHLMYRVLHHAALCRPSLRAGFLHLPQLDVQAGPGVPCFSAQALSRGLAAAIEAIVNCGE